MPTSTDPRIEDIPRIAFVTQRFHELKGLKTALLGAGLLLGCLLQQLLTGGRFQTGPIQVLIVANMLYTLSTRELDRRYRETFGDPVASPRSRATGAMLGSFWGLVLTAAALADMFLQSNRPGPSIAALALAAYSLFVVVRDGPWRVHYLIVFAAGLAGAVVTAAVPPSMKLQWFESDPARAHVLVLAYSLMGLGTVAAGLHDHYLLASSLRPAGRGEDGAAAERRGGLSLTMAAIAALVCATAGGSLWALSPAAIGLGFPMVLIIAGALSQIGIAVRDINRWARAVKHGNALLEPPMHFDTQALVLMFGVALAVAIDSVSSPPAPIALAAAVGAWSAWVAVRDWADRKHYLLGAVASLIVVFLIPHELPSKGFAILVFAAAGALTVEALLDHWKVRHVDPI